MTDPPEPTKLVLIWPQGGARGLAPGLRYAELVSLGYKWVRLRPLGRKTAVKIPRWLFDEILVDEDDHAPPLEPPQ